MKKLMVICIFFMSTAFGAEDFYAFTSANQQHQFDDLTLNLRCLVCQNQNIAESNSALAGDLRAQIYTQIQQGKSNPEIVDYLVQRYGDYILYRPPLKLNTLALWFLPFLLLVMGLSYLIYYIRRERKTC